MLRSSAPSSKRTPIPSRARNPEGRRDQTLLIRRSIGFAAAFALVLLLALDGGGYDEALRDKVGLAIWALIGVGFVFGVLPRSRMNPRAYVALGGIAALAGISMLSLSWTSSDERTFAEVARVVQYLGVVALAYLSLNRHTWQGAAAGLAAAALVVPLFSLLSRLAPDLITDDAARALSSDRLSYPFGYWNAVGAWGAMAVAIGLCWAGHARREAIRALALAAVPAAAATVYLSYSRGGAIASVIAVVAAVAFSRHRWTVALNALPVAGASAVVILAIRSQDAIADGTGGDGAGLVAISLVAGAAACAGVAILTARGGADRLEMSRRPARIALAAAGAVAVLGAVALQGPIGDAWDEFRNESTVAPSDDPAARLSSVGGTRYSIWSGALDAYGDDSSRGLGAGTFEFYWSREGDQAEFVRDAHSIFLETLAELGVLGVLCLLAAFGGLIAAALAPRRTGRLRDHEAGASAAALAAFAVFLFTAGIDWMWEMGAVGTLAIGGVAVAGAGGFERRGRRPVSAAATAGLCVLAFGLAALQVPGLVSTDRVRASQSDLESGDLAQAAAAADDAVRAEPWAASPYAMRALVAQADGRLGDAKADLEEAIEREPENFRHHLLLGVVEARAGDERAARRQLRLARDLAPRSQLLLPSSPEVVEISGPAGAP